MFNLKGFISTHPTEIIIGFLIIITVLLIIIIINTHKETFTPLLIKDIQLESQGKKLTIDGINNFKLNIYADYVVYFTHDNKILTYTNKLIWKPLNDSIDTSQLFGIRFINPYQCYIVKDDKEEHTKQQINMLTLNGIEPIKIKDIKLYLNKYIWKIKNNSTTYTYYDLNIPYLDNSICYLDVEFTTNNLQLHKTGDYQSPNDWNNDNNTTQLHFWKGAANHPNSKYYFVYDIKTNEFTVFQLFNNKMYRFNVYGVADGCTKISPLKLYASNKDASAENELFLFDWNNDKECKIKTKCGHGYIGGKPIAHDQNTFVGSDVPPAVFTLYSYQLNKEINKNDFIIKNVKKLTISNKNNNIITFPNKNIPVSTKSVLYFSNSEIKKYKPFDRFNLKYHNHYIDSNLNINNKLTMDNKTFMFFKDSNGNIRRVTDDLIVIPKNYIHAITKKNVIFKSELYGDGRYCKNLTPADSDNKVTHIYLNKYDMPVKKCGDKRNYNYKYSPIRILDIDNFISGEIDVVEINNATKMDEAATANNIINTITPISSTKKEYCNLKYQAYYLSPIKKNNRYYFKCNSAHSNKQDYIIKGDKLINAENNDEICEIKNNSNKIIIMSQGLPSKLYGDGRYWMGQIAKVDDSRIREIYINQSDMPEKINAVTRKKHTGFIEITELKKADAITK